jgi:hypothetical protein
MTLNYLIKDKDISDLSNFKTKAKTKFYYEIHNRQDVSRLSDIYNYSKSKNLDILVI